MLPNYRLSICPTEKGVLAVFVASYAANASSALLANTLLPLVRDVERDIMSSNLIAFIVLNPF
jgi:hypothetical protein